MQGGRGRAFCGQKGGVMSTSKANIQAAVAEIHAVLRKHDLAGAVVLSSSQEAFFSLQLDASWNCAHTSPDCTRGTIRKYRTVAVSVQNWLALRGPVTDASAVYPRWEADLLTERNDE